MTTETLASRNNPRLEGHGEAEAFLLDAWNSGRMPHAWLITGVSGIGKATLAYRIARFALAQGLPGEQDALFAPPPPVSLETSPDHPVFRRVSAGGHADLLTVERPYDEKRGRYKDDIAVDDVRKIGPFLRLTAAEGGWRVVVVDGADRMNAFGQNAILKILEEPPANALLLLTAENPGSLLPTIRSRTRKLTLNPLDEGTVIRLLGEHRPTLPQDEQMALARLSEGSIGRALALADAGGLALYSEIIDLLSPLPRLDPNRLHDWSDKLARGAGDETFTVATELLVWWLARLARHGARGVLPVEVVPGEADLMQRLLAQGSLDRWVEVWDKVQRLFARADAANLDRKQVVMNALFTLEAACAA